MRGWRVAVAASLVGVTVLLLWRLLQPTESPNTETVRREPEAPGRHATPPAVSPTPNQRALALEPAKPEQAALPSAISEGLAQERVTGLLRLAMSDEPSARQVILTELENPNRTIRRGALEAVVQLGDRSLTNHLLELAARSSDAEERALLLEAADFLSLPSLNEHPGLAATNRGPRLRLTNSPGSRPGWPVRSGQPERRSPTTDAHR
ncbi:MAG: HEAT repeat domain-containing protein [Verrucomicrobiales bacterium]|nr:HEAT repeat domain-containing protein [Verrucomicrobiales bacterium]